MKAPVCFSWRGRACRTLEGSKYMQQLAGFPTRDLVDLAHELSYRVPSLFNGPH